MKNLLSRSNRSSTGYALVMVMIFLGISLVILAGALKWTATTSLVTQRHNQYTSTVAAAEAATEAVIARMTRDFQRSEEHTSELQSQSNLVCRLLLEKKIPLILTQESAHPYHHSARRPSYLNPAHPSTEPLLNSSPAPSPSYPRLRYPLPRSPQSLCP